MTPEEKRVNAGWSVKPEFREYIRRQAEKQNLSASRYIEGLIIADMEIRSMEDEEDKPEAKKPRKK